ncbi:TetR/AcrR family transcriptional regulator [Microlunatus parietis]|uniref:AcrR family transcriptional regulator n=1 Tax=Microlunatus parietis TaxID=682979 RepID=A0A7Y9L857_9ACTN|nr:TetR/AcrR family transcriptional regulator C-terminal domain-containing protein [Microlunatus parietis]NYE70424.1 AcrR family transcriptional regulator [Microlunatus parietis]
MVRTPPGPKPRLDRGAIAEAAIEIIDRDGLDALSMRRLAERLAVAPGSLYTYLADRAELEALVLDTVIAHEGLPHRSPGTWRDRLEVWARIDWELYSARPWILDLIDRVRTVTPSMVGWLDSALRSFDDVAVDDQVKLDVINAVAAYVHGAALSSRQEVARLAGETPEGVRAAFERATALQDAIRTGADPFRATWFETGLHCLLAGIEKELTDRADSRKGRT